MSEHHKAIMQNAGLGDDKQLFASFLLQLHEETQPLKITWQFDETFWKRYKILAKPIGTGAYGDVFVGLDQKSKRKVVIKILHKTTDFLDHEIMFAKQLKSQDDKCPQFLICYIEHAVVNFPIKSSEKKYAIVFEYVAGRDLADIVEKDEQGKFKRIDTIRLKKLFCSALEGLIEIHARRIAHRDIKMENLRVDANDKVFYLDFGYACFANREPNCNLRAFAGTPCLTISYEVAKNNGFPKDALAEDVYALGQAFYPLFTGKDVPACVLEDNSGIETLTGAQMAQFVVEATEKKLYATESEVLQFVGEKETTLAQTFLKMISPFSKDRPTAKQARDTLCN